MAVETDIERAVFFDADDFGVTVTYTPDGGSATSITGIFEDEYEPIEVGGFVPVSSSAPIFHCKTSDVASAAEGDAMTIHAVDYIVRVVMNDGTGVTMLQLEKQ
jgi:hypothetical protein